MSNVLPALFDVNVAVTALLAFIVIVAGFCVPVTAPLQPVNVKPEEGVAVIDTLVPEAKLVPVGLVVAVPLPTFVIVSEKPVESVLNLLRLVQSVPDLQLLSTSSMSHTQTLAPML